MNEGVKILLERMKTNPEEFISGHKWTGLINSYKQHLSEQDAKTLEDAYNDLMQNQFTSEVMKQLLAPEEDDSLGKPWYTKRQAGTQLGGATLGQSWVNNQLQKAETTNLQELLAMKAQQELLKVKKSETLYGRLKNYLHSDT